MALAGLSVPAVAQEASGATSPLRLSGFGTVGLTHTEAPQGWGFQRSLDQRSNSGGTRLDADTRLGLQANYAPGAHFELVGQTLLTNRASTASDSDSLEWAFAAYRPNGELTVRAGRLNFDQFLMSDYRNVGFAYPMARPPVEYYGSIPTSLDGADLTKVWNDGATLWRGKLFAGKLHEAGVTLSPAYGLTLARETDGLTVRAGLSHARFSNVVSSLEPVLGALDEIAALPVPTVTAQARGLHNRLDYKDTTLNYATLGVAYEPPGWQVSAEVTRVTGSPLFSAVAGYASVGRNFGAVTLFGAASTVRSTTEPLAQPQWAGQLAPLVGPALAAQAQGLGAATTASANRMLSQQTYSVGARWNVQPRVAVKFQFDHTRIDANGSQLWANGTTEAASANVSSILLDFVF